MNKSRLKLKQGSRSSCVQYTIQATLQDCSITSDKFIARLMLNFVITQPRIVCQIHNDMDPLLHVRFEGDPKQLIENVGERLDADLLQVPQVDALVRQHLLHIAQRPAGLLSLPTGPLLLQNLPRLLLNIAHRPAGLLPLPTRPLLLQNLPCLPRLLRPGEQNRDRQSFCLLVCILHHHR
jgi:hypothetical protein